MIRPAFGQTLRNAARHPGSPQTHYSLRAIIRRACQPISLQTRPQSTLTSARSWTRIRSGFKKPCLRNYSSQKPSPDVTSQLGSPEAKPGLKDKLKELFKKYGYLSVAVYLTLSALDFPFCFLAVRLAGPERIGQLEHRILSNLEIYIKPVWTPIEPVVGPAVYAFKEVVARMWRGAAKTAGFDQSDSMQPKSSEVASIWTQLAIAYGIHKTLLIFVRVPLTAALTPRIARALQKRGWKIGSSTS